MMNGGYGWMDGGMRGGMWIWAVTAIVVVALLVVIISKLPRK